MMNNKTQRKLINHKILNDIISYFESRNVKVEVKNHDNFHMVITGEERIVNFYPTTGTINCNPSKKYKPFKLKGAKHETAIKRVVDLANIGY